MHRENAHLAGAAAVQQAAEAPRKGRGQELPWGQKFKSPQRRDRPYTSIDLIEEGTGVWLHLKTSSGEPWSRRLLTERKKADKMTFIGASLIEMFIEQKRCSEEEEVQGAQTAGGPAEAEFQGLPSP
ncbi:uncharacterized protein [Apostichopus japonicus]|uniref:uncharacterized protein isoform X3 n=1 Tax=Stichopus japonicus TaxID=307972 RepID=UPI003AB17F1B